MKKLLVVTLVAFSSFVYLPCLAQFNVYHPFPDSNAWWTQSSNGYANCALTTYYDYYVRGDTIVDGKTYFKVNKSGGVTYFGCPPYTAWFSYDSLYCFLREDTLTKEIFASFKPNLGEDLLLYDFNLLVGDTLPTTYDIDSSLYENYVQSIDSILIGTQYRKQFIITNSTDSTWQDSIIEGIGSSQGLLTPIAEIFAEGATNLLCFTQNNTSMYPNNSDSCQGFVLGVQPIKQDYLTISIFPNPNSGKFNIQFPVERFVSTVEIYNVLGEKVYNATVKQVQSDNSINLSSQPNGVYFYRAMTENGELIGEGKLIVSH